MKKIINTIAVISMIMTPIFAQSGSTEHPAMVLVRRNYSGTNAITATFDHTIYWDVREREERKSGELIVASGNRFRATLGRETFVSDGTTYWQYNERNSQVIIRNAADIDASTLPTRILSTFLSNRRFTEQGRSTNGVELLWDGGGRDVGDDGYTRIVAVVEERTGVIKSLRLTDKNNNIHTFAFKRTTFDRTPRDDVFRFSAPRGVEIVDMRSQ